MRDVLVLCEGQTEREFCNRVLASHIAGAGVAIAGTLVGKPGKKRGGISAWQLYRRELLRLASGRQGRHVAVLVDYYAMPDDWPGRTASLGQPCAARGTAVEDALVADLATDLPGRFHPCVQLHEFEALLFVDPACTAANLSRLCEPWRSRNLQATLDEIRNTAGETVEHINDSPQTAPSKRLQAAVAGYDKVASGVDIARQIGIDALRAGCPWLDRFLTRLESLGSLQHG
jgi:hypothetical protein